MDNEFDIAIVGMAGRFPGARDLAEFWRNLDAGVESIDRLTDEELLAAGTPRATLARTDYVKAAPRLEDADKFDAGFFAYPPAEAAAIDPQQRVLLELAHLGLEDAGCDPSRFRGRIGLFAGSAMNTYFMRSGLDARLAESYIPTLVGTDKDFLATRISYKLGLRGPSITIQTACSTSLVAIHLARQSLLNQESDVALAGAVSVRVPLAAGYFYDGSGVVSPDGHVRAFDAAANGTVFGSGAGIVVLKRLADALAQGDRIHAVIKGSAVNNDGSEKAGFTAPSVDGQADAMVEALANAGVDAADISYLEAHGSGTPVGDRIELLALTKAFRTFTPKRSFCALGSVKTNVGHLDAAAGIAGVIKTVLALEHGRIPRTLHFERPNEGIDFPGTPFFVNKESQAWPSGAAPRRAAVMSTGMGGTNASLVLEEAPAVGPPLAARLSGRHAASGGPTYSELLVLSAKTPAALAAMGTGLAEHLEAHQSLSLGSVARTLQLGRRAYSHRRYLVCNDTPDAVVQLRDAAPARAGTDPARDRPVVFLLPGVGDQYVGMGRGLYERYPVFKVEIDRCAEILRGPLQMDFREMLFPAQPAQPAAAPALDFRKMVARGEPDRPEASQGINRTVHAQPILFSVEYALARLWMSWGAQPTQLVGHSMGEYVAACLAGVFPLSDALKLIAVRAQLVDALPEGAMVAVLLPEAELLPLLGPELSISLINGPALCVVAGPVAAMAAFRRKLDERKAIYRAVRNAHAFHSRMLDPIAAPFAAEVRKLRLNAPTIPFISNVTGTWITPGQATSPEYWANHARRTARFSDALGKLWELPEFALIEAGPGRTLGVLALQHPARRGVGRPLSVPSLRSEFENAPDAAVILKSVGQLWSAGLALDWSALAPTPDRPIVSLPGYPFERQRHWLEAAPRSPERPAADAQRRLPLDEWTHVPSWQRCDGPADPEGTIDRDTSWLVLGGESELASRLGRFIGSRSESVVCCPRLPTGFDRVARKGAKALNIAFIVSPGAGGGAAAFSDLLALAVAIDQAGFHLPVRLGVICADLNEITGDESVDPTRQLVMGPVRVIPKEYPGVTSFALDIPRLDPSAPDFDALAGRIVAEFKEPIAGTLVALRGRHRWEPCFRPQLLPPATADALRQRGVYLITGGTGGIGLAVAKFLAKSCAAQLVLTKRSPLSPNVAWLKALNAEIGELGGSVEVHACDVTNRAAMSQLLEGVVGRLGPINGIIHAAGILDDGLIALKSPETAAAVLAPKVTGTEILHDLARGLSPDFMVIFSSLASIAPFAGQSDYCSAHAFVDGFAQSTAGHPVPVTAINWPVWRDTGMSTRLKVPPGHASVLERRSIAIDEGIEIFRRALASRLPQIIVSPLDLQTVLAESNIPAATANSPGAEPGEPGDEVEGTLENIWAPLLDIAGPIDPNESFFNLGGHSLLAMQVVSQVRGAYQVNFTLRKFFESPTIAGTAAAIRAEVLADIEKLEETVPEGART